MDPTAIEGDLHARESALDLARAGLGEVRRRVIAQVLHDLNGRASALWAILEMERARDADDKVLGFLEVEISRLERATRVLALLPEGPTGRREATLPGDVAAEVRDVAATVRGLDGAACSLEVAGDVPPVRVDRALLRGALLVAVDRAAAAAAPGDDPPTLRVGASGGHVEFRVTGPAGTALPERERDALAAALAPDGGSVACDGNGSVTVRVPIPVRRARTELGGGAGEEREIGASA